MKVKNETHYITTDLKRIFAACVRHRGFSKSRAKMMQFHCVYLRGYGMRQWITEHQLHNSIQGWAYVHGNFVCLKLPRNPAWLNVKRLIQVTLHELDHCLGLHHDEMAGWWTLDTSFITADAAVGVKEPKGKKAKPCIDARLALAVMKRNAMLTKVKLYTTLAKKYGRRIRALERVINKGQTHEQPEARAAASREYRGESDTNA